MSFKSGRYHGGSPKRSREDNSGNIPPERKPKKRFRRNEDELDDVDDWEDEPEDEEEKAIAPSEKACLEAKRYRRQRRGDLGEDDGRTKIDETTSLETDGIPIEPFNMEGEETDGSGYFDGDTYVFRMKNFGEEPDAWLDTLDEEGETANLTVRVPSIRKREGTNPQDSMEGWTKERLYECILSLLAEKETVSQAVRRYGKLLKKKGQEGKATTDFDYEKAARTCLENLTGAANALLLRGDVDVYDSTQKRIRKLLYPPMLQQAAEKESRKNGYRWEYVGNQDAQIHGPYTTDEMIGWTKAGYFVGDQRVKVRCINEVQLTAEENLLADLLQDDDETAGNHLEEGAWMWSNEVDFNKFLPNKEN